MKSIVLGSVLVLSMLLVIPQQVGAYDFQNWRTWDTISQGSSGGFVGAAQINLHSSGIQSATGPIDGIFGAGTNSGVRIYQDAEGLGVDGIVGPNTWGHMEAYASSGINNRVYDHPGSAIYTGYYSIYGGGDRREYVEARLWENGIPTQTLFTVYVQN